jgi:hypothetical protein
METGDGFARYCRLETEMKFVIIFVIALGLGTGGFFLWKAQTVKTPAGPALERPTTAVVESRDISFAVSAAGDIGPADQVSVRSEINGKSRLFSRPVIIFKKLAPGFYLVIPRSGRTLRPDRLRRRGHARCSLPA